MKKLILLFFMCSGMMFGTQIKDINKGNMQTVSVEEFTQLKSENDELKIKIADLEKVVNSVKDVKEASNIYYNVDQFYKSSWEKLLWVVGVCGAFITILITLFGFIFAKYENSMKNELEKKLNDFNQDITGNKIEIEKYVDKRIKDYESLITTYKESTINKANETMENILQEKLNEIKISMKELSDKYTGMENAIDKAKDEMIEIEKRAKNQSFVNANLF